MIEAIGVRREIESLRTEAQILTIVSVVVQNKSGLCKGYFLGVHLKSISADRYQLLSGTSVSDSTDITSTNRFGIRFHHGSRLPSVFQIPKPILTHWRFHGVSAPTNLC